MTGEHQDWEKCCCGCDGDHSEHRAASVVPPVGSQPDDRGVSLGAEVEREVASLMAKRYGRFISGDERFSIKTGVCHRFGYVSGNLTNPARTTQLCVEVCVECEENDISNPVEAYQLSLDVADIVLLDYFDSDRISHYLPVWQRYDVPPHTVLVRLEHANPALDDEASAFLRAHGFTADGLVCEDGPEGEDGGSLA